MQVKAHSQNSYLLKPENGMVIEKLGTTGVVRSQRIIDFLSSFPSNEDMIVYVDQMLDSLQFGVLAERFEKGVQDLGTALGFQCQQPDRQWKAGPDNLWAFKEGQFVLIECKNCVSAERVEINKDESGQMNNACAWFDKNYPGASSINIMITPARELGDAAGFNKSVFLMRESKLKRLKARTKSFFQEFRTFDLKDLSAGLVDNALKHHKLQMQTFVDEYTDPVRARIRSK